MTEMEIMKELFVALSEKNTISLSLKDGSSATGCVGKFDGTSILLDNEEIKLSSIESIEKAEEKILNNDEEVLPFSEQGKASTSIDFNIYKSKLVHIRFSCKDIVEEDEGVLFDYQNSKIVLVTRNFKRIIDKNDVFEIAEIEESLSSENAINNNEEIPDYIPNRFESALIAGEKEVVESYISNPLLLEGEGYSEKEATWISKISTTQAPWKDEDTNRIYNQARRVFTYIKNRNHLAERLFHKCLENERIPQKLKEKAINTLIGIAEYESREKLIALFYQYKDVILNNTNLTLTIANALTRAEEYDLTRSIINSSSQNIDFSETMFSLAFHEKYKDYDFSSLPGLDSLDERVTIKELKLILALPNKASCIQLLNLYCKLERMDSFFAILDLFLPYAKDEGRIVETVSECLKQTTDNQYLLDYLPKFPLLWFDKELTSRYLDSCSDIKANSPITERLINQCLRAKQYSAPNNLELSIIQGNWISFEAQRENDSILYYDLGYSVEEAKYIRAFDIETIKYGNKPAIERLLLFEGNKNHIAESTAGIDFLRAPEAVCKQLFPIFLNEGYGDLIYELYNYSQQIKKRLFALKKDYLKALLLLDYKEEYWEQVKDGWMNLGLDSDMLVEAKSLAEQHNDSDLADLLSLFAAKKPFNDLEIAIISGNVSRLRTLITDADSLIGSGYTSDEIRLIQESARQRIDFSLDDYLSIANRLYVFQKNKNRSAEFYYKLALEEKTELAASGLFSIYASESRFAELCSLYESKLQNAALVIDVPGNKKAYMNALFQTKQYEKFYRLWETDKDLVTINSFELLIVLLETNASLNLIEEIINDQLSITAQNKELIIRCISLLLARTDSESLIEMLYNNSFLFLDQSDIGAIKESYNWSNSYHWANPSGNGIRGLNNVLSEEELKAWIDYLFELFPENDSHVMIVRNVIEIYENGTDEFYNLINEVVEELSNNGVAIPETLAKYLYPRFKNEEDKTEWLEKKIASLTDADEATFDLVCDLSSGMKDKTLLRNYLISISNRKLPFELKYVSKVSSIMHDLLTSEEGDSQDLIDLMRCIHNQMIYGHVSAYDILILYQVYIKLQYNNYAYMAYCSLNDNSSLDDNQHSEVIKLYERHLSGLNLSIFDAVLTALKQKSLRSFDQFSSIWKDYLRISEPETKAMEELKDYYNQPEKWSKDALESLSKNLICSPTIPKYWRLLKLYCTNSSYDIICNILFHQAQVEKGSYIPALLAASDGNLFSQMTDIFSIVIKAETPTTFEKDREAIDIVISNHPEWIAEHDVAYSFVRNAYDNIELKKDLRAWTFISEQVMKASVQAGIEKDFFELYKEDLESIIPVVNEKFICELILKESTDRQIICSAYSFLKTNPEDLPYKEMLIDIVSNAEAHNISQKQYEILKIISKNNGNSINEYFLYEYYTIAVANSQELQAVEVFDEIEKYYPDLEVLDDIKKYETVSKAVSDEDILQIYNAELEKLKTLSDSTRIEKVIINMIPGEMYLESRGITVESVQNFGLESVSVNAIVRIRKAVDMYSTLDNAFDRNRYPELANIFMKCSFLRKWKEFIEYDLDSKSINAIIRSDDTVHGFLMKKPYDILKSAILSILDSSEENQAIIDRTDAIIYATGSIYQSKEKLSHIQTMNDDDKTTLRRIFSLRIESKSLRTSGIIGSAILKIPNNENLSEYISMLGEKCLSLIFDHNTCFNTLMRMPKENALIIAEKYSKLFDQNTTNVFAKYLRVKNSMDLSRTSIDSPFNASLDKCTGSRDKYLRFLKTIEEGDQKHYIDMKKYIHLKVDYLYNAVIASSDEDIERINPSKTDYLSVISYLFNSKTIDELRDYIRKLDTPVAVPALCALLSLLEQYFLASNTVSRIANREWKDVAQNFMYRCLRNGTITAPEKQMKYSIERNTPFKKESYIVKYYPTSQDQYPAYVEKMESLRTLCISYAKYLSYNKFNIPYIYIDMKRFNYALKPYRSTYNAPVFNQRQQVQYTKPLETIETIVEKEHITNLIRSYPNVPVAENTRLSACTLEECVGSLKYIIEVKSASQDQREVLYCKDVIRWIYIKLLEKEGYDRENFNHILEHISERDTITKQQWNFIYAYLVQYFGKITDLQQLSRIIENDINNLRNIGKITNNTIRFLGKNDINTWMKIIEVLGDIASINFQSSPENEQITRLSKNRSLLNAESSKKTAFDQIITIILRLMNDQIMRLRRNPELSIEIPEEQEGNIQNILWQSDNEVGMLYSVISNIGGADCHQVELVSTINMTKSKKYTIDTIYLGERIPFHETFGKLDLVDGKVTWTLEVSFYDDDKKKTISVSHELKAFIQTGGEPLKLGKIDTGMPARGQNFVGRKRELTILRSRYSETNQVPSMLIRGLKRSGKSSIIIRFAEEIKKKNKLIVASVDGQIIVGGRIKMAFCDKVLESIMINYGRNDDYKEIFDNKFEDFRSKWEQKLDTNEWMGYLDSFYYELSRLFNKKILIILDEMESVFYSHRFESVEQEESLYAVLRALIQNPENYVSFIFCGSDTLLTSCLEQRRESQMFQTLHPVEVGQMGMGDIQDIFRLQSDKYDIQFTKDAVDTIWQYTHGLVWYAKLLGYLVIDNIFAKDLTVRKNVNSSDIVTAVQMLLNGEIGSDKFDLVDASLTTPRTAIVHAMANLMPDQNKQLPVEDILNEIQTMRNEGYINPRNAEPIPDMDLKEIKSHLDFLEKMQFVEPNASRTRFSFTAELYRLFFRSDKRLHLFEERRF